MRVLTAALMKQEDEACIAWGLSGPVLMERAALGAVDAMRARWPDPGGVLVLAGPGNNGGDGLAMARLLLGLGHPVQVLLCADPGRLSADARAQWRLLDTMPEARLAVSSALDDDALTGLLDASPCRVDALLGIGTRSPLRGEIARVLALAASRPRPRIQVAVDLPSGLDTDTAQRWGPVQAADLTVTFHAPKPAHLLPPGAALCGALVVVDIGIPPHLAGPDTGRVFDRQAACETHRPLARDGHKARHGRAWLRAGSVEMPGAAVLAAGGACRSGVGYIHLASPPPVTALVVARHPSVLGSAADWPLAACDALGLGSGVGVDAAHQALQALDGEASAQSAGWRLVIDADGLTALAQWTGPPWPADAPVVLMPHPGELARLLGVETAAVQQDLAGATREAARRWCAVVLARSAGSVVATPSGTRWWIGGGSPGLGRAGTGDVLMGLLTGLMARLRPATLEEAAAVAALAAWIHADASRRAVAAASLTAADLVELLPATFADLEHPDG
jgi:NAD(P)H-hydrate epimerase